MVEDFLEYTQRIQNNKYFGNEISQKNKRRYPTVSYSKTWVYHHGGQPIPHFHGQALIDKWQLHHIADDAQEMGQLGQRLGAF